MNVFICVRACDLLHNGGQPPQGEAALIAPGHHRTAELHHDPLGVAQFAAVGEGAAVGSSLED